MAISNSRTVGHQEACGEVMAPPSLECDNLVIVVMLVVDKDGAYGSRSRIHIFVIAPGSKVYLPFMESQGNIPSSVCQIPSNKGSLNASCDEEVKGYNLMPNAREQRNVK